MKNLPTYFVFTELTCKWEVEGEKRKSRMFSQYEYIPIRISWHILAWRRTIFHHLPLWVVSKIRSRYRHILRVDEEREQGCHYQILIYMYLTKFSLCRNSSISSRLLHSRLFFSEVNISVKIFTLRRLNTYANIRTYFLPLEMAFCFGEKLCGR